MRNTASAVAAATLMSGFMGSARAQVPNLGTAANYAVLAGQAVVNTGPSVLTGDVGVSPGSSVIGFPPGVVNAPSSIHISDAIAIQAQVDLVNGYNAIASRPTTVDLTGTNLAGLTLTPGVYNFATGANLSGALTLNALGNPNAVFIFNIASTLTTGSASSVNMIGGGTGNNVYWRVGSSATLGTTTSFIGDILALTSITLNTGANITCGSALARNGAVTLDTNNISTRNLTASCTMAALLPTTVVGGDAGTPTAGGGSGTPTVAPGSVVPAGGLVVVLPAGTVLPFGATQINLPPGSGVPSGSIVVILPAGFVVPAGASPFVLASTGLIAGINRAFLAAVLANGGNLPSNFPQGFLDLTGLSAGDRLLALQQLSGEAATGMAPNGMQAMNSFLSLVLNPYAGAMLSENRGGFGPRPVEGPPLITKAPYPVKITAAMAAFNNARAGYDPSRWGIWGAAYGSQTNLTSDIAGLHDRSGRSYGFAAGVDYRLFPNTIVGFALGGGATSYGLAAGLGGGRSDMFQAAVYASTRFDAAYVSAALAYAWHDVTTEQYLSVISNDRLTANYNANNVGGRIEAGYRFRVPSFYEVPSFGITPYMAAQGQAFFTPAYSENAASQFARSYRSRTSTGYRTEAGVWFDTSRPFVNSSVLTLRSRVGYAHDEYSDPILQASFLALPGSDYTVTGIALPRDLLLASAGAEVRFANGIAVGAQFDGEFADRITRYGGTGRVRYSW
ncbi:MAG: ice-binding family protein [Tardiphaga sp.]